MNVFDKTLRMSQNKKEILRKIEEFLRKYYINKLLQGIILFITISLLIFLAVILYEGNRYSDVIIRTILFVVLAFSIATVAIYYIVIPILRIIKLAGRISYEDAARIIGKKFSHINDKLLNIILLDKIKNEEKESIALVIAEIERKSNEIKIYNFRNAISFRSNKKYVFYMAPVITIFFVIIMAAPAMVFEPTKRILQFNTDFIKPAPFHFQLLNDSLKTYKYEDLELKIKLKGSEIPNELFVINGKNRIIADKKENNSFFYKFNNVKKDFTFRLEAGDFLSKNYHVHVIAKPVIKEFTVFIKPPEYTDIKPYTLKNTGDFSVNEGSHIQWVFRTRDASDMIFNVNGKTIVHERSDQLYKATVNARKSFEYEFSVENANIKAKDTMHYDVFVKKDEYPKIEVIEFSDSLLINKRFFTGMLEDDYGFTKCLLVIEIDEKIGEYDIPVRKDISKQEFYYSIDMNELDIAENENVTYYFAVYDNDKVNGSKRTVSKKFIYKKPTGIIIEKKISEEKEKIKDSFGNSLKEINEMNQEIDKLRKELINKEKIGWEEKEKMKQLNEKTEALKKMLEKLKERNETLNYKENQLTEKEKALLEKQKELEKMMEKLLDDDIKELMKEYNELMEEMNKEKLNEMLEEMKMETQNIEEQLDRNLELFKSLEFDMEFDKTMKKLEETIEKQQENIKETEQSKKNSLEDEAKRQKEIEEDFQEIKNNIEKLEELNNELEFSKDFKRDKAMEDQIMEEMKNAQESLMKNKKKHSLNSQESAKSAMEKMKNTMQQMMNSSEQSQMGEDIRKIREILENLLKASFQQEELMKSTEKTSYNHPGFHENFVEQKELQMKLGVIEDTLAAIAKRQIQIQPYIKKEINDVNYNIETALSYMENRNTRLAASKQQYAMTSVNNLILLLGESLQNMQNMMNSMSNSKGKGQKMPKPGGNSQEIQDMRSLQEMLKKNIESLKNNMGKSGENSKLQSKTMSEQLVRLAAQQEALRKELQKLKDKMMGEGNSNSKMLNQAIQDMEATEKDLVNKVINRETILRQKRILTRLLESEKAEMEREKDEKRESKEGIDKIYGNQIEFLKYKRIKENSEKETIRLFLPDMNNFYKEKINNYFYNYNK